MANFLKWVILPLLLASPLGAKDLGIYGSTATIEEEDLICFLTKKIQSFSEKERQAFMQSMRKHLVDQLQRPMAVEGIRKTACSSVSYFDPSIRVERDILNDKMEIVVKKGSYFNPLSQISLNQDLIFFDATDSEQLAWAQTQPSISKWILIKGQPMQLEERLNRPIYFDQGGGLTKKFGIIQVPARISQEGMKLKIEYIPIQRQEASCANCS